MGSDEASWHGAAMAESMQQLAAGYRTAMMRATADYQMREPAFRNRLAPLRLPALPERLSRARGTVAIPEHDYASARDAVAGGLFTADPVLLRCVRAVFDESYWLRETVLLVTSPASLDTPSSLDLFMQKQTARLEEIRARFTTLWTPAVEQIAQQELAALPEFERAVEMEAYLGSRIPRVLKQLGLLMQDELCSLVLTSIGAYLALLKSYSTPEAELHQEPSIWAHGLPFDYPALLRVTLQLSDGQLVFEPPLDELAASLHSLLEAFVVQTAGVPSIGKQVMHMLALPEETLATLSPDDAALVAARQELHDMLECSMVRPRQLLALFQDFSELAAIEIDAHLASVRAAKHTLPQYKEQMDKWHGMAQRVMGATAPEVHCRLLLVECGELKSSLAAKAEAIARGIAGLIADELQTRSEEIGASYSTIHSRLQQSSGSAEEVVEMNAYLQSCEMEMQSLKTGIEKDLEARLELLSSVNHPLPDECFSSVYTTLGWPTRVYAVAEDAAKKQEEDRNHFMEQLRADRERFSEQLEEWDVEIKALSTLGDMAEVEANAAVVSTLQSKIDDGKERASLYNSREELFGWPVTEYLQLNELNKALEPYNTLWTTAINFQRAYPTWLEGPFLELSAEQVEADVSSWWRQLYKLGKSLTGLPGPLKVVAYVKEKLDSFKSHLPLIQAMLNPGMRDRHWKGLAEQIGHAVQPNEMSTLSSMLEQKVGDHLDSIQEMSDTSSKEYSLEKALDKMLSEWKPMAFDCMEYRDTGTYILRALDDIQTLFDDHIVKTQAMRGSPFVKPFEGRVRDWEAKLISMQEIIDEWLKCQSVWLYLEPIFSSEDIMRQMPQEAKRFTQVDRLWRKVMATTEAKPNVLIATSQEGLLESWQQSNHLLELIQQGLNDYLEAKRLVS